MRAPRLTPEQIRAGRERLDFEREVDEAVIAQMEATRKGDRRKPLPVRRKS